MPPYSRRPGRALYLSAIAVFRGHDAAMAATRRFTGMYPGPSALKPGYEPRPLPGFVRLRDLDTKRRMPPCAMETAIDEAVADGDWRPISSLLDDTRGQWARRSHAVLLLAEASFKDQSWLMAWERDAPDAPGALLVRAERTIRFAWQLRGAHFARYLSNGQIDGFRQQIALAEEITERATAAAPDDPTPYERGLRIARGRSWPHQAMETLWTAYTDRNPHGFEGHLSALQYWCAKWRGSHGRARSFAAEAAANAPQGSFLNVLPLIAAFEEHGLPAHLEYRTAPVNAAVDACLEELRAFGDAYPWTVYQVRHVLAYFLNRLGRHGEAAEQFRAIDGYVDALPWSYFPNTVQEYGWFRRDSVRRSRSKR